MRVRRTHLRGHTNILTRLLVHASGFNLGLFMRTLTGIGTPRSLQGRVAVALALFFAVPGRIADHWADWRPRWDDPPPLFPRSVLPEIAA